jgi:hypothetical protein
MVVYAIPIPTPSGLRYELYCPAPADTDAETPGDQPGLLARFSRRFAETIRDAEQRQGRPADGPPAGRMARLKERMLGWIAERVAEQRLLWNLRRETAVALAHADDVAFDEVIALVRSSLKGDYDRHRRWLVIDSVGLIVSALLALVPGPNLVAYFFIFRVGGHWFSMRGATQGLSAIAWSSQPEGALRDLRAAVVEAPRGHAGRIVPLAAALDLPDLPAFIARMADGGR